MDIEQQPKHPRSGLPDLRTCTLCMKKLDGQREIVKNPTTEGLKAIFSALEIRKDTVHDSLLTTSSVEKHIYRTTNHAGHPTPARAT